MTSLTAIILGIIEGATEFIPVSSTGHLMVLRRSLDIPDIGVLSFDAILQFSATLAIVLYFWRDIWRLLNALWDLVTRRNIDEKDKTLLYAIVFGSIPAVIFGLILESKMETVFRNVNLVAMALVLGSGLLWIAEKYSKKPSSRSVLGEKKLTVSRGIIVGFFQCLALVPGMSRSGSTISGGLLVGFSREEAIRFSFLLSIPILLGSGLKKLFEMRSEIFSGDLGGELILGSFFAFFVGLLSINFLFKYLKTHSLNVFIIYRLILAGLIFIIF